MVAGLPLWFFIIAAGVLGAIVGSFLNVVIYRIPAGMSTATPRSSCPKCGHPIRSIDNIPLASWLILGGKCRDCRAAISMRYPLVELATAITFALVVLWASNRPAYLWLLPAYLYFAAVTIALSMIDIDTKKLPNRIVLPSLVAMPILLVVGSLGSGDWWSLLWALAGGAALFIFYFTLVMIYPAGMGFGDVKLAALVGLALTYLGWGSLIVGAFAAFLLGGVFSIILLTVGNVTRKSGIPFGPWMLAGAWVGIVFGEEVSHWYLTLVGIG